MKPISRDSLIMNKDTLHIYTRVSSLVQSEDGTSLDTQKDDGIKKAKELGYGYKVWNEGGKSSSHDDLKNRPVLTDLLAEVDAGNVKYLYVYNTDRLSRNELTWSMIRWKIKTNNVVLISNSGVMDLTNPMDNLMIGVLSAISQYDNNIRTERSRRGKLEKVKQGYYHGGPPPFGYEIKDKKLVVNKKESKFVQMMFELYATGTSVKDIRKKLSEHNVMTRRGNLLWSLGSIEKILKNRIYIGSYTYHDKSTETSVEVSCPVIIDQQQWNYVNKKRTKRGQRKHQINRTTHFYMLRDFMECGHCGQMMSGRIGKNNNHYYCPHKERKWVKEVQSDTKWKRGNGCTMIRSLNITKTDDVVWNTVIDIAKESKTLRESFRLEVLEQLYANRKNQKTVLKRLSKQKKKLMVECDQIEETLINFQVSQLTKKVDLGNPAKIKKKLEQQLFEYKSQLQGIIDKESNFESEIGWVDWLDRYESDIESKQNITNEEKREFLSQLIDKVLVFYDKDKNEHSLQIEFSVPIVSDQLIYNNPDKRSEGWTIQDGERTHNIDRLPISKGGRPSNLNVA